MLLKKNIICSRLLESISEILGDDYIHHVHLFKVNAVFIEANIQVILQSRRQLTLDVSDFASFNSSDKISDSLFALLSQQFFQFISS